MASSIEKSKEQRGLQMSGNKLPEGLNLKSVSFFSPSDDIGEVSRSIDAQQEVAVFKYSKHGDFGYTQTLVAISSMIDVCDISESALSQLWRSSEIKFEQAGRWIVLYRKQEQIAGSKLAIFIEDCKELVLHLESSRNLCSSDPI